MTNRGAEVKLQKFGLLLEKAEWLWPLIDYDHLEALLKDWPSEEDLSNLQSIRLAVQNNDNVAMPNLTILNSYYLDSLAKRGTMDTETRSTVQALLNLWKQTTDWNRRYLGLLVAGGEGVSSHSPSQFINYLPNMNIGLVSRFQSILTTYKDAGDAACIELVTILANYSPEEVITYWRPILYSMIEVRGTRLLEFALKKFKVENWVEWLRNVRWALGADMLPKQNLIQIREHQARDPELGTLLDNPNSEASKQTLAQPEGVQGQNLDILMTQKPESPGRKMVASSGKAPAGGHAASIRCPLILDPDLYQWSEHLNSFLPTVSNLDENIELGTARRCLLLGGNLELQQTLVQILSVLSFEIGTHAQTTAVVHAIIPMLSQDGRNAAQLLDTLTALARVTDEGARACLQLMDFYKNNESEVAEIMLAGWLGNSSLFPPDEAALEALGTLIGVRSTIRGDWSDDSLKVVANYFDAQYSLVMEEAVRLNAMRIALKIKDPIGMSEFLESIGVEDVSPAEAALSDLPPHLINVVDKVGEREIEILFPLTHLTQLQRAAMGVDTAQSLVVRVMVGGDLMPPGFCIHLDTELKGNGTGKRRSSLLNSPYESVGEHAPWIAFPEEGHPDFPICHGKIVPAKYQLARVLSRHLSEGFTGFKLLGNLHALVTDTLKGMGRFCIACGAAHGINLRRPTVCKRPACNDIFLLANLEVRLADIQSDPAAVDLLLTMVFAAALSNNLQLLPNCPFTSTAVVIRILNTMPSMTALSSTWKNLDSTINKLGPGAVQLLTWALSTYRGYLASATGILKVPGMPPGTNQFILANASPEQESDFQAHIDRDANSRLLFHGTSPGRLFAILCQGLQIKSNTPLQANGAASGAGIYMAEEPMTSWVYTTRGIMYMNWGNSAFRGGFRVLLGCENAGPRVGNSSMHVIRYVTFTSCFLWL